MNSRRKDARIAGLLYIVASVIGVVRLVYIPSRLFVWNSPAATVNNLTQHEVLFRFGILSYLVSAALWIFVILALYRLLKDVDRGIAAVMVILGGLMQVPLFFMNAANDIGALLFARGSDFLSGFAQPQRAAFTMLFLNLHHQVDLANGIFWGLWLIPFGLLVYRSGFLPRILGIWLMLGCFGYLANSFSGFIAPQYQEKVWAFAQPLVLSEVATMMWLVIIGAKEKRMTRAPSAVVSA